MKKVLAFAGSNSSQSINKKLIDYTSTLFNHSEIEVKILNLINFDAPIYSPDIQTEKGFPQSINKLYEEIKSSNAFVIATPEHNGMITAFFKNLMDWLSRIDRKFFDDKPILLLSSSPGKGGGKRAIQNLETLLGYFAGNVIGKFSLPSFNKNFNTTENILTNNELSEELKNLVEALENKLHLLLTHS